MNDNKLATSHTISTEKGQAMPCDIHDAIFNFAFGAALNDATMQKAFLPVRTENDEPGNGEPKKNAKKAIADASKEMIGYFIDKLLGNELLSPPIGDDETWTGERQTEYDYKFQICANEVANCIPQEFKPRDREKEGGRSEDGKTGQFTFGNIQKLINMTLKYMFTICYTNDSMRKRFMYCHCPMDSIMMRKVDDIFNNMEHRFWKLVGTDEKTKAKAEDSYIQAKEMLWGESTGKKRIFNDVSWSQIGFKEGVSLEENDPDEFYEIFQALVRTLSQINGISPIEFDYLYWQSEESAK